MLELRALDRADLPRLLALYQGLGAGPPLTLAELDDELFEPGRRHGHNVVVAHRHGQVCGYAGWVDFAAPAEFYLAPLVAADQDTAACLLGHVAALARAVAAPWLRVSSWPGEGAKLAALAGAGARPIFDFITFAADARQLTIDAPPLPAGWRQLPRDEQPDFEGLAALAARVFVDVANAPPAPASYLADDWPRRWPEATTVLLDDAGDYAAWVWLTPGGVVDTIGVDPRWKRRGVARALLARAVAIARGAGRPGLEAVIASNNVASLGLFRGAGFVEERRRTVFQLELTAATAVVD